MYKCVLKYMRSVYLPLDSGLDWEAAFKNRWLYIKPQLIGFDVQENSYLPQWHDRF
jgi:hypothetical protein